jgi:NitT/TauT family transport system ATP-binding protein
MSPIVSLKNVQKQFNGELVVKDVSFTVETGEVLAMLGQTGAGKSTILNLILGQLKPSVGEIVVDGCDPFEDYYALRGKVSVSFQSDRLLPWRTARENVELGLEILRLSKAERRQRAAEWLERVKLGAEHHEKYPHQLSGGMRQRVSLARALVVDPDLLLLDESFSQLDAVTSRVLRSDFLALIKQLKKTCILITHRIEDALEMADRILVVASPAQILLDLRLSELNRKDVAWRREAFERIAAVMGGTPLAVTNGASEPELDPVEQQPGR